MPGRAQGSSRLDALDNLNPSAVAYTGGDSAFSGDSPKSPSLMLPGPVQQPEPVVSTSSSGSSNAAGQVGVLFLRLGYGSHRYG